MSRATLRFEVEAEFAAFAASSWQQVANAAWLAEQNRKRVWGADAWRFNAARRAKGRDAVRRHFEQHHDDDPFRQKNRAKCKAYRARRKADPARARRAKQKRKAAYAREWAALRSNPVRYAKQLAWTRAWRARKKEASAA